MRRPWRKSSEIKAYLPEFLLHATYLYFFFGRFAFAKFKFLRGLENGSIGNHRISIWKKQFIHTRMVIKPLQLWCLDRFAQRIIKLARFSVFRLITDKHPLVFFG